MSIGIGWGFAMVSVRQQTLADTQSVSVVTLLVTERGCGSKEGRKMQLTIHAMTDTLADKQTDDVMGYADMLRRRYSTRRGGMNHAVDLWG